MNKVYVVIFGNTIDGLTGAIKVFRNLENAQEFAESCRNERNSRLLEFKNQFYDFYNIFIEDLN